MMSFNRTEFIPRLKAQVASEWRNRSRYKRFLIPASCASVRFSCLTPNPVSDW